MESAKQPRFRKEHVQNYVKQKEEEDQEHKIYVFRVVHSNVPLWIRGEPYLCKCYSAFFCLTKKLPKLDFKITKKSRQVLCMIPLHFRLNTYTYVDTVGCFQGVKMKIFFRFFANTLISRFEFITSSDFYEKFLSTARSLW